MERDELRWSSLRRNLRDGFLAAPWLFLSSLSQPKNGFHVVSGEEETFSRNSSRSLDVRFRMAAQRDRQQLITVNYNARTCHEWLRYVIYIFHCQVRSTFTAILPIPINEHVFHGRLREFAKLPCGLVESFERTSKNTWIEITVDKKSWQMRSQIVTNYSKVSWRITRLLYTSNALIPIEVSLARMLYHLHRYFKTLTRKIGDGHQ